MKALKFGRKTKRLLWKNVNGLWSDPVFFSDCQDLGEQIRVWGKQLKLHQNQSPRWKTHKGGFLMDTL